MSLAGKGTPGTGEGMANEDLAGRVNSGCWLHEKSQGMVIGSWQETISVVESLFSMTGRTVGSHVRHR